MADHQATSTLEKDLEHNVCRHHWAIDSPAGPTSKGVCLRCGEEREFKNYIESLRWEDFTLDRFSPGGRSGETPRDADEFEEVLEEEGR